MKNKLKHARAQCPGTLQLKDINYGIEWACRDNFQLILLLSDGTLTGKNLLLQEEQILPCESTIPGSETNCIKMKCCISHPFQSIPFYVLNYALDSTNFDGFFNDDSLTFYKKICCGLSLELSQ